MFNRNRDLDQSENQDENLFKISPSLRAKLIKQLAHIVKKNGLQGLYEQLDSLPIGKEFYLSNPDLYYLASFDRTISHLSLHNNNLIVKKENKPAIIPQKHPIVREANGEGMEFLANTPFQSWEMTINNVPALTFFPKTIQGLQHLVLWAKQEKKRLRAAGYRHTSADFYSQDDEILVSMLDLKTVTKLPADYPKMNPYNDLQGIKIVGEPYEKNGELKVRCQIGASTCNYHFQDWLHHPEGGNQHYAMPLNVIMVEISFAGSTATLCHGAGINNKTISDLVTELKFINVKGEEQIITDKQQIKAAAGSFGLLGIVTSLTFELNKMTYANFKTVQKKLIALTIPPAEEISPQLKKHLSKENLKALGNSQECDQALQTFIELAEECFYTEFFWFPLHDQGWINCWKDDGEKEKSVRYPNSKATSFQRQAAYLAYLANHTLGDNTPNMLKKIQTKLFSLVAMTMLPDKEDIVCSLEDAIHFRKGIQNFKTRMVEFEIPIPNLKNNGKPDWSICQKAWWAGIECVYNEKNMQVFPMRTSLEMRIMGGSDMLMAAQYGNERTCSIEILSPATIKVEVWDKFIQEIIDKWAALKDEDGKFLNIRPHWAKRFDHMHINRDKSWIKEWDDQQKMALLKYVKEDNEMISVPMRDYLKHIAYKNQIPNFIKQINNICQAGGYKLKDLKQFSNPLIDDLIYDEVKLKEEKKPLLHFFSTSNATNPNASRSEKRNMVIQK